MTIRVQATTSSQVAASTSAAGDKSEPTDLFAALLGTQLGALAALPAKAQGDKLGAALGDGKSTSHDAADDETGKTAAVDPATLLAIPVFVPPVVSNQPTVKAAASAGNANVVSAPVNTALSAADTGLTDALAAGKQESPTSVVQNAAPLALAMAAPTGAGTKPAATDGVKAATKLELFQTALNDAASAAGTSVNAHALLADAAAQARPAGAPPVLVASTPSPLPLSISTHLSDSNWSHAMGQQLMTMANLKSDQAQISLNPSHLGPIEVSLKIDQNQAQVVFNAATPQAREAVENSLPRLASMLAGSGIQLSDAQVSSGQSGDQRQAFGQQQRGRRQDDGGTDEPEVLATLKAARGILSTFA
ncbi:flagellar hook-length control protein FliK [Neisseriaceae bacterium JH1-16]|nr:flagellar hook-length control protein FliK [Neisseriaceae bacterium JH1-16]